MEILALIQDFNIWSVLVRMVLSALLGGIIGFERGIHGRAAGLRTHILVCVGSAITALIGVFGHTTFGNGDTFRISAQVISGIGFLGVGMILVRNRTAVTGLTTAAGLWTTSIIGIAVGYGFYIGALIATLICFISVTLLGYIEKKGKDIINIYIEISDTSSTRIIVQQIREIFDKDITVNIVSPKSSTVGHIGILVALREALISDEKIHKLQEIEAIDFFVEDCNA